MSNDTYYDTNLGDTVRNPLTQKRHRIRVHNQVPYITYKRKTRVLFQTLLKVPFINVNGDRVVFQ